MAKIGRTVFAASLLVAAPVALYAAPRAGSAPTTPARAKAHPLVLERQATTLELGADRKVTVKTIFYLRVARAINSPELVVWIGGLSKPSLAVGGVAVGRLFGPWSDGTRSVVLFRVWRRLRAGERFTLTARSRGVASCRGLRKLGAPDPRHCVLGKNKVFKGHWAWQHVLRRAYREYLFPKRSSLAVRGTPKALRAVATGVPRVHPARQNRWFNTGAQGNALVAAPFASAERTVGKTTVRVHLLSARKRLARWADVAADIVRFYSALYGVYPPRKLDIVELPRGVSRVAFSTFATVFVPRRFLRDDASPLTLAHEIGHQWFGSALVTNAPGSPYWLAEGLAWHAALLYAARRERLTPAVAHVDLARPVREARMRVFRQRLSRAYRYGVLAAGRDLRLHRTRGHQDLADLVSYHKGALLLELVRLRVGSARFFAGMSSYVRRHRKRRASVVGLRDALSIEGGVDLRAAFRDYDLGYPRYRVAVHRVADPRGGEGLTRVTISGDRPAHVSLPLHVITDGGRRVVYTLPADSKRLVVTLRARVADVRLDPDHRAPRAVIPALRGDVVIDGVVDGRDLLAVAGGLDLRRSVDSFGELADVVADGVIDQRDVDAVLRRIGQRSDGARWFSTRLCWLAATWAGCKPQRPGAITTRR